MVDNRWRSKILSLVNNSIRFKWVAKPNRIKKCKEETIEMKTKLVKDLMVPLSDYATVSEDATLNEAVLALKQSQDCFDQTKGC